MMIESAKLITKSVSTMIKMFLRAFPVAAAMGLSLFIGSCDSGTPGGGGTGDQVPVLAIGPISGFGSVIVNGIRYDDTTAVLRNELGNSISASELRLGMMVEVRGARSGSGAIADSITSFSELKGLVENVDSNNITVNGVRVLLVDTTIFYEATTLVTGDQVEVYGSYDSNRGAVIATRIERKSLDDYKLRGTVSALDTDNEQFNIGSRRVSYSGTTLPANLIDGVSVKVYSNTAPDAGVWPVSSIRLAGGIYGSDNGDRVEVEGVISQLTNNQLFVVNGFEVDASGASFFDGAAGNLAIGRLVEVKGTIEGNRLIAETIEFEDNSSSSSGNDPDNSFEVTGTINRFQSISDFTVRNVVIDASQTSRFDDGTVADLAVGACVEVRGGLANSGVNTVLLASRIEFEDDC